MKYIPQHKLKELRLANLPRTCAITGAPLTPSNSAVDHDHNNGLIRGFISSEGNAYLGRVENAYARLSAPHKANGLPFVLRAMADYLEHKPTQYLHPKGAQQITTKFKNKTKEEQINILEGLRQAGKHVATEEILNCKNSKDRTTLFSKLIKQ